MVLLQVKILNLPYRSSINLQNYTFHTLMTLFRNPFIWTSFVFMIFDSMVGKDFIHFPSVEGELDKRSDILLNLSARYFDLYFRGKGSDHLAHSWGVLADFWVPNEIDSVNLQRMLLFWFLETSQNVSLFRQLFS